MKIVADLHIHSHFSRATSKNLDFEHLTRWAQLKGVHIVGTGDIAHPGWLAEMHDKLEPAEPGLFRLKDEIATAVEQDVPPACQRPVRFLLAGEISNIYKKGGKTRKVHNVIFAPSLAGRGRHPDRAGEHRQHPLRWPAHPGAALARPAGDHPGGGRALPSHPRPHLDALVLAARLQVAASTRWRSASTI